jgi:hypothetical protein
MLGGGKDDTTKLQECILSKYDMMIQQPESIADECDCSESYVKQTLNEYRDGWNDDNEFGVI